VISIDGAVWVTVEVATVTREGDEISQQIWYGRETGFLSERTAPLPSRLGLKISDAAVLCDVDFTITHIPSRDGNGAVSR
jgi:hypothetical protein